MTTTPPLLTDEQIAKALAGAGLQPEDYREDGQIEPLVRAIESATRAPLLAALEEANAAIALIRQQRAEWEGRAVFAENDAASMRLMVERLTLECNAKQAEIDRLMLEFCPDEMTPEQLSEWEAHQVLIDTAREATNG